MKRTDLYDAINNKILAAMENGSIPWQKPWLNGLPLNLISKKPYHGVNFILLSIGDYISPYYLTYNQVQNLGGKINKGEHGQSVIFWKIQSGSVVEADGSVTNKTFPLLRYSTVFNVTQTTLWDDPKYKSLSVIEGNSRIETCEQIIKNVYPAPIIEHSLLGASYSLTLDKIKIPPIERFLTVEEYYASLFHELIHWTGSKKRLNRIVSLDRKSKEYAFEELIAEIGSAYLCGYAGIVPKVIDNSASYIEGWMRRIKEDAKVFVNASKLAAEAVESVFGTKTNSYSDSVA
jgi:antirestriction protein ArdC